MDGNGISFGGRGGYLAEGFYPRAYLWRKKMVLDLTVYIVGVMD